MMTNKSDYVLGIHNYCLLDGTWDKDEFELLSPSNNEGTGL